MTCGFTLVYQIRIIHTHTKHKHIYVDVRVQINAYDIIYVPGLEHRFDKNARMQIIIKGYVCI